MSPRHFRLVTPVATPQPIRFILLSLVIPLLLLVSGATANAQQVFFDRVPTTAPLRFAADLNNDGRADLVGNQPNGTGFTVSLSTGDGTYAAPQTYPTSPTSIAVGDFNGDGFADLVVTTSGKSSFDEYLNNGDGTLHLQATFLLDAAASGIVTGDFNHDGKIDIAFIKGFSPESVVVWFGNGDGGFTPGPETALQTTPSFLFVGDFDGDGNADLMGEAHDFGTTIEVQFGDNTGHFSAGPVINASGFISPEDVNGDGKMDLVEIPFNFSTHGSIYHNTVNVYYGSAARTFTQSSIPLGRCGQNVPTVADFNGDGIPDLAVEEVSDCKGAIPNFVSIMLGNGDGTFQPEQDIYSTNDSMGFQPLVLRANKDTKPDLAVPTSTGTVLFMNTSTGNFPGCAPPAAFSGIFVCTPGATAAGSPVAFSIGAAGQTRMRKVEVWVDGTKKKEQLGGFSNYSFLDADIDTGNGTHVIDVYGAGWDNMLVHKSFTVNVGTSGGGGGGSCPAPNSPGVNVCSPQNGSNVTSPVTISATGKNTNSSTVGMDVWLDGFKIGFFNGDTVNTQVSTSPTSHELDIYAIGGDGEKIKSVTLFTVGGGAAGCPLPSGPGVNICSPTQGQTVTSPVHVLATGRNTNSATEGMDVWIDGAKVGFFNGNSVDIQANVPSSGTHQLDIYAVGFDGEALRGTVLFSTQGSAECPAPSGTGALNLCYPINGSTTTSPVYVAVHGCCSVDTIEMWLDGTKFLQRTGTGGNMSIGDYFSGIGPGGHRLTFVAKVAGTVTDQKSTTFTVH